MIGSKRTEMGSVDTEEQLLLDTDSDEEIIDDTQNAGTLTSAEKAAVMMDLRP